MKSRASKICSVQHFAYQLSLENRKFRTTIFSNSQCFASLFQEESKPLVYILFTCVEHILSRKAHICLYNAGVNGTQILFESLMKIYMSSLLCVG